MTEISGTWKPTAGEPSKKLANACEVTHLKLVANAGAAFVSIYDGASITDLGNLVWVLDASTTDVDSDKFDGLVFKNGVVAVCEQGIGFNPVVAIARIHYEV